MALRDLFSGNASAIQKPARDYASVGGFAPPDTQDQGILPETLTGEPEGEVLTSLPSNNLESEYPGYDKKFRGLDVRIENVRGSTRSGTGYGGEPWTSIMAWDYGEIPAHIGKDGDPLDVFLGPNEDSDLVVLIHQCRQDDPLVFDEHKAVLGFDDVESALDGYLDCFEDDWILGPVVVMAWGDFLGWLEHGDTAASLIPGFNRKTWSHNDWVPVTGHKGGVRAFNPEVGRYVMGARAETILGQNAKRYIRDASDAPDGVTVETGTQGGLYYETGSAGGHGQVSSDHPEVETVQDIIALALSGELGDDARSEIEATVSAKASPKGDNGEQWVLPDLDVGGMEDGGYSAPGIKPDVEAHGITWMSPEDYMAILSIGDHTQDEFGDTRRWESREGRKDVAERMAKGLPIDPGTIDIDLHTGKVGQEGRHRAMAAHDAGIPLIPITIVPKNAYQDEGWDSFKPATPEIMAEAVAKTNAKYPAREDDHGLQMKDWPTVAAMYRAMVDNYNAAWDEKRAAMDAAQGAPEIGSTDYVDETLIDYADDAREYADLGIFAGKDDANEGLEVWYDAATGRYSAGLHHANTGEGAVPIKISGIENTISDYEFRKWWDTFESNLRGAGIKKASYYAYEPDRVGGDIHPAAAAIKELQEQAWLHVPGRGGPTANWDESKIDRDDDGKFASTGSASKGETKPEGKTPLSDLKPPTAEGLSEYIEGVLQDEDVGVAEQVAREAREGKNSKTAHQDSTGNYKPQRSVIHKRIVDGMLNPKAAVPTGDVPKAVFTIGPPAAGKGSVLGPMLAGTEFTVIDPDKVKEALPEYDGKNAAFLHEESSDVAKERLMSEAIAANHNIQYDGVGTDPEKMVEKVLAFKDLGYDVEVHFIEVEPETTVHRIVQRFTEEGRWVPLGYAAKARDRVEASYELMKAHASSYSRWSNEVPRGEAPKMIENSKEEAGHVRSQGDTDA